MFSLMPRNRLAKKAAAGEGGALTPLAFPLFRRTLFPEFDRLFDGFWRDWEPTELKEMVRKVEVEDKPDAVVVRAEAPGFKPEEFEIEVRDELLFLHAIKEKKLEVKEKKEPEEVKEYLREEFYEAVTLPGPVSVDKAAAKYVNGVLIVTLPKATEAKGRRVPVTTT